MSLKLWAAPLAAAAWVASAGLASAADLYSPYAEPYRQGSPYEDPRYGDIYRQPGPAPYAAPYREPYGSPRPPGYLEPFSSPRFGGGPTYPDHSYYNNGCVPRQEVKDRLLRQGWHAFTDLELRGEVAFVRARRPNGRTFELQVDRCSGNVIEARPADAYPGAFAWGPRGGYRAY
jgi:hypothetical protein